MSNSKFVRSYHVSYFHRGLPGRCAKILGDVHPKYSRLGLLVSRPTRQVCEDVSKFSSRPSKGRCAKSVIISRPTLGRCAKISSISVTSLVVVQSAEYVQ